MRRGNPEMSYWGRRITRARHFEAYGYLYSSSYEPQQRASIRFWCEVAGIPMGYGRVGRIPLQLNDEEAAAQWRAA